MILHGVWTDHTAWKFHYTCCIVELMGDISQDVRLNEKYSGIACRIEGTSCQSTLPTIRSSDYRHLCSPHYNTLHSETQRNLFCCISLLSMSLSIKAGLINYFWNKSFLLDAYLIHTTQRLLDSILFCLYNHQLSIYHLQEIRKSCSFKIWDGVSNDLVSESSFYWKWPLQIIEGIRTVWNCSLLHKNGQLRIFDDFCLRRNRRIWFAPVQYKSIKLLYM